MDDDVVENAYRTLRGTYGGQIGFGEHLVPIKVAPAPDGHLVAPVMVAMLQAFDTVLFLPDDDPESLQIQVTLEPFDESGPNGALADRWRAYHGEPPDVRWAILRIDAAKHRGYFIDGEALVRPNPLESEQTRLCRTLNADRGQVAAACEHGAGVRIESPTVVGVDPAGFDVRGQIEMHRLSAPHPMSDAAAVEATMRHLAAGAGGRPR